MSFHVATNELLGRRPQSTTAALSILENAERRLGIRLPASVREWYSCEDALPLLAQHSNDDPPIPVQEFEPADSTVGRLLPIRWENQGVCTWAILLDGSADPPVFVDVDSGGTRWQLLAPDFSTYVYTCIWDYRRVFHRPALVQAQNDPISADALEILARSLERRPSTFGWPGSEQYRFDGGQYGILVWSSEGKAADWIIGADDATSLESALRIAWSLDDVGGSFYDCSDIGREVLAIFKAAD